MKKPTADKVRTQRDSAQCDPIRLGPSRTRTLSLDGVTKAEPEADLQAACDWSGLCVRYGLTRLEERAIIQHLKNGVARYQLHTALGCTRSEAGRALDTALVKIGGSPAAIGFSPILNSRRLAFRERFANGKGPWSLNPLSPEFIEVMGRERNYFFHTQLPDTVGGRKTRADLGPSSVRGKIMDLKLTLQTERQKLTRIGERLHANRNAKEQADNALATGQEELRQARADAILADRTINHSELEKRLSNLQVTARARQVEFDAAQDAHRQQVAVCERLESEITTRAKEFFSAEARDVMARIRTRVPALADDMAELQAIAARHGQDGHALAIALYPPLERESYRGGALQVVNPALALNHFHWQWPQKKLA